MKQGGMVLFVLAALASCATNAVESGEAPAGHIENQKGRSVEWLRQHCPDCLGRGPKVRP